MRLREGAQIRFRSALLESLGPLESYSPWRGGRGLTVCVALPLYRGQIQGSERLGDFPKVTQLAVPVTKTK